MHSILTRFVGSRAFLGRPAATQARTGGRCSRLSALRLRAGLALLLGATFALTVVPATSFAAEAAKPAPAAVTQHQVTGAAAPSETQSYEAREAQSKSLENFKGGDTTVVIASSTLILVLVIVLIVVLI